MQLSRWAHLSGIFFGGVGGGGGGPEGIYHS